MKRFQIYLNSDDMAQLQAALALVIWKMQKTDPFGQGRDARILAMKLAEQTGISKERAAQIIEFAVETLEKD